jgi:hypothetical protein
MLDVRPTAYVVPLAEQVLNDITPVVQVLSSGGEAAKVTGLIRIYRKSTDQLLFTSTLAVTLVPGLATVNIAALSAWSPPAPADDDYFILCDLLADSVSEPCSPGSMRAALGAFTFDVKPGPMGPAPAAHGGTHEDGGMDEVDVTALSGELADDQPALAHDIAGARHTSTASPGQVLQADANGLPVDATNTDTQVADVVKQTTPQSLADGAAIDWDLALGGAAQVTLGGDRTLNAPSNMVDGARYRLKVIQDGTGTRLLTWNAAYRFPGGVDPCLSAAINCFDILIFDCDGTHCDCVGMVNALA